jgi:hypothetical protein
MELPVPDFVADGVAAEPSAFLFQLADVTLVEHDELLAGDELAEDHAAGLVGDLLPYQPEVEFVEEPFYVESGRKAGGAARSQPRAPTWRWPASTTASRP